MKIEEGTADEEQSLHDLVREAVTAEEVVEVDTPASVEDEAPQATSDRDEQGRFVPKDAKDTTTTVETPPVGQEEGKWSAERPPSSWHPAVREQWKDLSPEVRAEITRREENAHNGARQLHEQYAPLRQIGETFDPILRDLASAGLDPNRHVYEVMKIERSLRSAALPDRFDALLRVADAYGIPVRDIINKSVGQEVLTAPQQPQNSLPPEVRQELDTMRKWREEQEQKVVNDSVERFGADKEFFQDVRHHMANLLDTGLCKDLETAYEVAVWATPELRQVMVERSTRSSSAPVVAQRQARAAGVSLSPNRAIAVPEGDSEDDSIGDTIRKAMKQVNSHL